jgi:restriction system protein
MQKAAERARVQLSKAQAAEHKRLEKEALEAHIAAKEAEVEERNQELSDTYADIDTLLASTLSRDDYVDLATLRVHLQHPPFGRTDLEKPVAAPAPIPNPVQPDLQLPEPPRGIAGLFGKKKYAQAVEAAKRAHEQAVAEWQAKCGQVEVDRRAADEKHARAEQNRLEQLARERVRYAEECQEREEDAAAKNRSLDELIANLGYGTVDAVQEYVSIVLSNSVYPDQFPVTHEFNFAPETAELELRVEIPEPGQLPSVKAYKYTKASDEIVSTSLSQKECRERYASAVHQVALRSFHEIFEADRRGLIRTVSLEVGTTAVDPGTGRRGYISFVIAAAERDTFLEFDLSAVVPAITLARLGAAMSKNPHALAPTERAGVRRA